MDLPALHPRLLRSSEALLRAIAEAHEAYERRYRELVGDEPWRNEDDAAASWAATLRGERPTARVRK